jgi:hypothetical protein
MLEVVEYYAREGVINTIIPGEPDLRYNFELMKVEKEFEQIETPLCDATCNLLSGLQPIYRFWRDKLKAEQK